LLGGLRAAASGHASVGDVRGLGCMVALEFVTPDAADPRAPNPGMVKRVLAEALKRDLIALSAGSWGQVVRVIPPLVTTAAEVDQAVDIMARSLEAAAA
jgi:4-aminobutyrate aminotransferase